MDPTSRRLVIRIAAWTAGLIVIMGIYYAFIVNKASQQAPAEDTSKVAEPVADKAPPPEEAQPTDEASQDEADDETENDANVADVPDAGLPDQATEPSINLDKQE